MSRLTDRLIAQGCEPRTVSIPATLYGAFFEAALDALRKGAPGLTDARRATLARSIALRCEQAAKQQEKAA